MFAYFFITLILVPQTKYPSHEYAWAHRERNISKQKKKFRCRYEDINILKYLCDLNAL